MKPHRARGFTLLEVLVALGVFAIVTLLAWKGLDLMTTAKARLDGEMRRWRELELVFERVGMDLTQIAPRNWTDTDGKLRSAIQGSVSNEGANCQLDLLRFGNDNQPLHPRYRVADGRLTLQFLPFNRGEAASAPAQGEAEAWPLLEGVSRCELSFIDEDNTPLTRWPKEDLADMARPNGLRLRLTLEGRGTFERIYYIP